MSPHEFQQELEPQDDVPAESYNGVLASMNYLNGRPGGDYPVGAWQIIRDAATNPARIHQVRDTWRTSRWYRLPAEADTAIGTKISVNENFIWNDGDQFRLIVHWRTTTTGFATGRFRWTVQLRIERAGFSTEVAPPQLGTPFSIDVPGDETVASGPLASGRMYVSTIEVPFLQIAQALENLDTAHAAADQTARLIAGDVVWVTLTRTQGGVTGTQLSTPILFTGSRLLLGGTAADAERRPFSPRNGEATVSGSDVTVEWDNPFTPPQVQGFRISIDQGDYSAIQSARIFQHRGASPGTHTYDIIAVGGDPWRLESRFLRVEATV